MTSPDMHGDQAADAGRSPARTTASSGNAAADVAGVLQQPRFHQVQGSLAIVVQAASNVAAESGEEQAFANTHCLLSRMPPDVAVAMGAAAVVQLAIRTARAAGADSPASARPKLRRE